MGDLGVGPTADSPGSGWMGSTRSVCLCIVISSGRLTCLVILLQLPLMPRSASSDHILRREVAVNSLFLVQCPNRH
jgi:hypothetical protein